MLVGFFHERLRSPKGPGSRGGAEERASWRRKSCALGDVIGVLPESSAIISFSAAVTAKFGRHFPRDHGLLPGDVESVFLVSGPQMVSE